MLVFFHYFLSPTLARSIQGFAFGILIPWTLQVKFDLTTSTNRYQYAFLTFVTLAGCYFMGYLLRLVGSILEIKLFSGLSGVLCLLGCLTAFGVTTPSRLLHHQYKQLNENSQNQTPLLNDDMISVLSQTIEAYYIQDHEYILESFLLLFSIEANDFDHPGKRFKEVVRTSWPLWIFSLLALTVTFDCDIFYPPDISLRDHFGSASTSSSPRPASDIRLVLQWRCDILRNSAGHDCLVLCGNQRAWPEPPAFLLMGFNVLLVDRHRDERFWLHQHLISFGQYTKDSVLADCSSPVLLAVSATHCSTSDWNVPHFYPRTLFGDCCCLYLRFDDSQLSAQHADQPSREIFHSFLCSSRNHLPSVQLSVPQNPKQGNIDRSNR